MKLVKLSLAAVVAAGAFSAANAVALDEAIQNVDLHGMLRYRYDAPRHISDAGNHSKDPAHKLKAVIKVTSEIADNFKAHGTLVYQTGDLAQLSEKKGVISNPDADTHEPFRVREAYLEYNNFDTQFNVGKMLINSIWTDDIAGDGITVTNKSIEGVTFAAFMFDNFERNASDLVELGGTGLIEKAETVLPTADTVVTPDALAAAAEAAKAGKSELGALTIDMQLAMLQVSKKGQTITLKDVTNADLKAALTKQLTTTVTTTAPGASSEGVSLAAYDHNLYGAAVLADFDPVSAQAWISYLGNVGTFYALDLAFNGEVSDGVSVMAHAQFAGNSLKGDLKDGFGAANGTFFGLEAGINAAGFDGKIGWVNFGKKDKYTIHSLQDKGQLINSGVFAMDEGYHGATGKRNFIFGEFGYTYEGLRAGFDIISGTIKVGEAKTKALEITPRVSYKYSDKLKFSAYYAIAQFKTDDVKEKDRKLRLEAKYTF